MAKAAATALFRSNTAVLGLFKLNESLRFCCLQRPIRAFPVCKVSYNVHRPVYAIRTGFYCSVATKKRNSDESEDTQDDRFTQDENVRDEDFSEDEDEDDNVGKIENQVLDTSGPYKSKFPVLTSKEKKELRGHAHRLGKDITLQHIGKWGVTPSAIQCLSDALEKNELMKVRVLDNCPAHITQVVKELEQGLDAQVVGKVGHVILLYRPSLRKAELEEKKLELASKKKPPPRQRRHG